MDSVQNDIFAKGGQVAVNRLQPGDRFTEWAYGIRMDCQVLTKPQRDGSGSWTWKAKLLSNGETVDYCVTEGYQHYGPELFKSN
jgi:hypothetical protein